MKTQGLTAQDIKLALPWAPRLINYGIEKLLCPNMKYRQILFRTEADVSKVFKWALLSPQETLLGCSSEMLGNIKIKLIVGNG